MLLTLLLTQLAFTEVPPNADRWAREDAALGPLQVCELLVKAAKDDDFDGVAGRSTAYSRAKFGQKQKLEIRAAHNYLVGTRCVKISAQDDKAEPATALVWVYIPQQKSRDVPFVREAGFWRLDQKRYEELRAKK